MKLKIKESGEIHNMIEEILDKPLKQWTSEDESLVSKKWVSVESLKQWLQEKIQWINEHIVGGLQCEEFAEGKREAYEELLGLLEKEGES